MDGTSAYLELTFFSAADLKRGWFAGEETSALAWVDPSAKKWTSIVNCDGSNVQWPHEKLTLSFNGDDDVSEGKLLTIEIYARGILGVSLLGSVYVPLADLASHGESRGTPILMYQIVPPNGNQEGSLKFSTRVMWPASFDASEDASGVAAHVAPPTRRRENEADGVGSKLVYPSVSGTRAVRMNDERRALEARSPYPSPPQPHFIASSAVQNDSSQHTESRDVSRGLDSYPSLMYSPVEADHPTRTSRAANWPHPSYTGNMPYPPAFGTPHPPPASVHAPATVHPGSPYQPVAPHPQFPQMIPQHLYSSCACPFHPPAHAQLPATIHHP